MPNVNLIRHSRRLINPKINKKDKLTVKKQLIPEAKPAKSGARPWINQPKRP
jgi:hypothetical protein